MRPGRGQFPQRHDDQRDRQRHGNNDHRDAGEPAGQQERQARDEPGHDQQRGQDRHRGEQHPRCPTPVGPAAAGRAERETGGVAQGACAGPGRAEGAPARKPGRSRASPGGRVLAGEAITFGAGSWSPVNVPGPGTTGRVREIPGIGVGSRVRKISVAADRVMLGRVSGVLLGRVSGSLLGRVYGSLLGRLSGVLLGRVSGVPLGRVSGGGVLSGSVCGGRALPVGVFAGRVRDVNVLVSSVPGSGVRGGRVLVGVDARRIPPSRRPRPDPPDRLDQPPRSFRPDRPRQRGCPRQRRCPTRGVLGARTHFRGTAKGPPRTASARPPVSPDQRPPTGGRWSGELRPWAVGRGWFAHTTGEVAGRRFRTVLGLGTPCAGKQQMCRHGTGRAQRRAVAVSAACSGGGMASPTGDACCPAQQTISQARMPPG